MKSMQVYRFEGEVFDNMYPQIVTIEIYKKVRLNRYEKRNT